MIHALRVNLISHMATGGQPHNGVYTSYKVHTSVLRLAPWGQGDKYGTTLFSRMYFLRSDFIKSNQWKDTPALFLCKHDNLWL